MSSRALAAAALLAALPAAAQNRPSEEDIFGGSASPPAQSGPSKAAPQRPSDEQILNGGNAEPQPAPSSEPAVKEDPLKIGGLLYLRAQGQSLEHVPPSEWPLTAPALVDTYMDVRPNDRVRGFLLARLQYDLARSTTNSALATSLASQGAGGSGTFPSLAAVLANQNPSLLLDQVWINFDVERAVFVTAGKQHVKWGVSRFWNPTDFLHPVRRDPLAPFDVRTGQTMLKLHLPWEKRGWNFYGMAVFDESQPSGLIGNVGAAGRAELVLGTVEVGIDGLVQRNRNSRMGVDFSAGIWELDVYGEAALRNGTDVPLIRPATGAGRPTVVPGFEVFEPTDFRPSGTLGASWSYKYNDEDTFTLGGEYFYNSAGYGDPSIYGVLIQQSAADMVSYFSPFYLGKHYAGAYLLLPKPGRWNNTTFTFSTLGNLSDRSFVSRIDYSVLLLTYLTFEAYVAGHYGHEGGEFRLSGVQVGSSFTPATPGFDFGVALRVNL